MELALLLMGIISKVTPQIVDIITIIRKKDGSITLLPMLDENDAHFKKNIEDMAKFLESLPKPPTP
jgi:hypothetical protein